LNDQHSTFNGLLWRELRRFALTNLRDFGMGRKVCEDKIIEEAQCLCQVFNDFRGKVFDMTEPVNCAVSNIISSLVYGSRFEYNDPEFTTLVKFKVNILTVTWFSKKLRDTLNPQMPRGFVDAFMLRQKNVSGSEAPDSPYQEENLAAAVLQLFAAGTETMSATLRSALLLMVKYPHIQDQVREEIFRVIGTREVQTEDRKDLPFTDAVLHETQRITNIVPLSLPRQTSQDITFQKYFIKRGTTVWPLLTSVLYEESEWEKPHSFYPAHFLHKDGTFRKRDAFMPFSAGRRICLGEGLARMELFIFFVTLMQRFRFTAPPGVNVDELELMSHVGFTLNSVPHKLCAIPCA
uniref:Uncharacterized protein n=1 Tax=Periophthalmus magnuspinnatus TaxID=409849 RepID=A0A3B4BAP9_9GOBI